MKFLLNQRKDLKSASGSKVDANGIFNGQKDAFDDLHGHSKSASPKSLENRDNPATAIGSLPIDGGNEGKHQLKPNIFYRRNWLPNYLAILSLIKHLWMLQAIMT